MQQGKVSPFVVELVKDGHTEIKSDTATLKICPRCENGTLSQKMGKFGPFVACSAHPECDYTKKLQATPSAKIALVKPVRLKEPMSEGVICPTCNLGTLVVRNGQNNQPFLGCSSFPKCRTTAQKQDPRNAV